MSFYFLLLIFSNTLNAQETTTSVSAKNAAYFEVGGNGIFYSFNYERTFFQKGIFKSAARVGACSFPLKRGDKHYWATILPVELIGLVGRAKHHLELGAGISPNLMPYTNKLDPEHGFGSFEPGLFVPFRIGYRYQKPEGGFLFRLGLTPVLDFPNKHKERLTFVPVFGGISVGKSF